MENNDLKNKPTDAIAGMSLVLSIFMIIPSLFSIKEIFSVGDYYELVIYPVLFLILIVSICALKNIKYRNLLNAIIIISWVFIPIFTIYYAGHGGGGL